MTFFEQVTFLYIRIGMNIKHHLINANPGTYDTLKKFEFPNYKNVKCLLYYGHGTT